MIKRSSRWAWRFIEGALVAATLAIVVLIAALSQGPVPLDFVYQSFARALDTSQFGFSTEIGPVFLVWDRNQRHIGIEVQEVILRPLNPKEGADQLIARFPKAEAVLSMRGLLHGVIVPSRIVVSGSNLTLVLNADGQVALGASADPGGLTQDPARLETAAQQATNLDDLRNALLSPVENGSAISFLKSVVIQGAEFRFRNQLGALLAAGHIEAAFSRTPIGLAADIDASLDQAGGREAAQVHLDLTADKFGNGLVIHGQVDKLVPSVFSSAHPALGILSGIDISISGTTDTSLALDGTVLKSKVELTAGPGTLNLPDFWPQPLLEKGGRIAANWLRSERSITIDQATMEIEDFALEGKGSVVWPEPITDLANQSVLSAPAIALDIIARGLSVPDVIALWPASASPGGRRWIAENMDKGSISPFKAHIAIPAGGLDAPGLPADSVQLEFGFQGLRTKFLGSLPPLDAADGSAKLTLSELEVLVNHGKVGALEASDGHVVLSELDQPVSKGAISLGLAGTMAETLRILNFAPLGYPARFGIDAPGVGGSQAVRVSVKLPLLETVTMEQVSLKVEGSVKGLGLKHLVGNRDLTDGDLSLELDNAGLTANGIGRLEGVPLAITWREDFNAGKKPSSRFLVSGIVDDKDRDRLGISTDWRARGPIGAKVELIGRGPEILSGKAELNLDSTLIDYPELDLLRLPDQPGAATFDIAFPTDGIRLSNIQLKAGEVLARGEVFFDKSGQMMSVRLSPIQIGDRTDLDISIKRQIEPKTERLVFDVQGRKFDSTGLMDWINEPDDPADAGKPGTPFSVSAKLKSVVLADEAPAVRNVTLSLNHDGLRVTNMSALAEVGDRGHLELSIAPKDAQHRKLAVQSDDAGAALESVDVFDEGTGGKLAVDAIYDDRTPNGPLTGRLEINDLRILKAPVLFQLLTVASVNGALDTLQGTGILFGESRLNFRSQDGRIYLSEGLFSGPMVALTLSGLVDQHANALELKGALVPLSGINTLLGDIPLIGDLIVGRKGEGIIGMDYSITGPSASPRIGVNPLSVLAPSFLKRIFDIGQPVAPNAP